MSKAKKILSVFSSLILVFVFCASFMQNGEILTVSAVTYSGALSQNVPLRAGSSIVSPNKMYSATIASNGRFALKDNTNRVLWQTETTGLTNSYLVLDSYGNIQVKGNTAGREVNAWSSGTTDNAKNARYQLVVTNVGTMEIRRISSTQKTDVIWVAAATYNGRMNQGILTTCGRIYSANKKYYAIIESNGCFALKDKANRILWQTGTSGLTDAYLKLNSSGNIQVIGKVAGREINGWTSETAENISNVKYELCVTDSGSIEIRRVPTYPQRGNYAVNWVVASCPYRAQEANYASSVACAQMVCISRQYQVKGSYFNIPQKTISAKMNNSTTPYSLKTYINGCGFGSNYRYVNPYNSSTKSWGAQVDFNNLVRLSLRKGRPVCVQVIKDKRNKWPFTIGSGGVGGWAAVCGYNDVKKKMIVADPYVNKSNSTGYYTMFASDVYNSIKAQGSKYSYYVVD